MTREKSTGSIRLVAVGLALGPAIALGFGRFAYALLLPAMRDDLEWSYAFAGAMNTANAAGYLAGALAAAATIRAFGSGATFTVSLLVTSLSLVATGFSHNDYWLLFVRMTSGLGGAIAFIAGAALSTSLASTIGGRTSGFVFTSYYAGAGAGIAASGVIVPYLSISGISWEWGWIGLGVISLIATLPAHQAAAQTPEEGRPRGATRRSAVTGMVPALLAYFLFALGYIAYMTYSAAYLLAQGFSTTEVSRFWILLGLAAVASPIIWSGPVARWRGGSALSAIMVTITAGAALPLLIHERWAVSLSAVLFGGSFLTTAAAMSALVRRWLPPHRWGAGIAAFTVVFAVGQTLGPWLAGMIADGAGGLDAGLALSAAALLIGALVALAQSERHRPTGELADGEATDPRSIVGECALTRSEIRCATGRNSR